MSRVKVKERGAADASADGAADGGAAEGALVEGGAAEGGAAEGGAAEGGLADTDASIGHLLARLDLFRARVGAVVADRRAVDPNPDDPYRGLYVDGAEADALAERGAEARVPAADPALDALDADLEAKAASLARAGSDLRLLTLARRFGLTRLDVDLLVAAVAPDLDPAFEKLYGYLNNDVTRRRASVGLALELCGASLANGQARSRLAAGSPLVDSLLVSVEDADRPVLSRSLRVPDRVVAHLLGDDGPDGRLAGVLVSPAPWPGEASLSLAGAFEAGVDLVYVSEVAGTAGLSWLAAAFAAVGRAVTVVDLSLLASAEDLDSLAEVAAREARLGGRALVAVGVDALADRGAAVVRRWAELPGLVALTGARAWDPRWSRRPPLLLEAPPLTEAARLASWAAAIGPEEPHFDLRRAVGAYRLTPEQVRVAARAAVQRAAIREPLGGGAAGGGSAGGGSAGGGSAGGGSAGGGSAGGGSAGGGGGAAVPEPEDLQAGARAQNAAGLEHLARRIAPRAAWEDLVLPPVIESQLRALAGRVRQRSRVLDDWRLASAASRGRGVTVLFAGDSGTGKTMSAEVVARSLGLDLYVIDLSTVVDKYIGETEKNLDRIFAEADRVNGVLLFDEADAIFGKRSEVKDARDRYANVEVAYLLQRMEQFEGVAILTTNLRANVDEAFLRRIDVLVEFSVPDPAARSRLWAKQLKPQVPVTTDIDIDFLSNAFEFSGGNIRNVVLAAAFEAAEADESVSMTHLVRATAAEYRKLGRLTVQAEFGPYFAALKG